MDVLADTAHRYEQEEGWAKLPEGWVLDDVAAVAVDSTDRVYVLNRGPHPVIVFDREGNFLRSFGEGEFTAPHGIRVTPDNALLITDSHGHAVYKYSLHGRRLMTIGTPGKPAPALSGLPFNRPTDTAVAPNGDIFIADGYGNGRVHRYSPEGEHLASWGDGTGTDPGQFNVVHNICCDPDGFIYIADRENHRLQVFDLDGRYVRQINNLHRPCGLYMADERNADIYVTEFGAPMRVNRTFPNLGARVSVLDNQGRLLGRIGGSMPGLVGDQFVAPHSVAMDSEGSLYVGEVNRSMWWEIYPDSTAPEGGAGVPEAAAGGID